MFTSWVNASITPFGYANVQDVDQNPPDLEDSMESFVLAET
jgi:mannosyl-oligosaccharide alpha-1,2-mannosidase